jgi:UDP-glucose 4-epimerase
MKKTILITGANGYIGARLALELSNNYDVYAHCYPEIPKDKNWISKMAKVFTADLREKSAIKQISDLKINTLIHLVSLDHHQSKDEPEKVMSVNVNPVWNLLDAFAKKDNLKQFIYFSTIHVYGKIAKGIINETFPANPLNEYALTHLMAEQIVNYYRQTSNIHAINVRLSNSYGSPVFKENNCWWLVINDLCKTAFEKRIIVLKSDGYPVRDFIHTNDLVRAVELLIETKEKNSDTNNTHHISSGISTSILEIATIVKKVFWQKYGIEIPIYINETEKFVSKNLSFSTSKAVIDNTRIKRLGFIPSTDIETGIAELFEYFVQKKA